MAAAGVLSTVAGASVAKPALRVSTDGNGVIASRDGRIDCGRRCSARSRRGTVISLSAAPCIFLAYDHGGGGCVETAARCFVVSSGAASVKPAFVRKTPRLELSENGPGTITSSPAGIDSGRA